LYRAVRRAEREDEAGAVAAILEELLGEEREEVRERGERRLSGGTEKRSTKT
jgi:hypothetical protein